MASPPPRKRRNTSSPTKIVLLNSNHLGPRLGEINWWLLNQISLGSPVDALMITEPVLDEPYDINIPGAYTITSPNPPSNAYTNKHLHTCCITYDEAEAGTLTEWTSPHNHLGITCVRLSFFCETQQPMYLITAYIPNPNAPTEYTASIYSALSNTITHLKRMRALILVGMDSNVRFTSPGVAISGRNHDLLRELMNIMVCRY